jgi:hypothetical protein
MIIVINLPGDFIINAVDPKDLDQAMDRTFAMAHPAEASFL